MKFGSSTSALFSALVCAQFEGSFFPIRDFLPALVAFVKEERTSLIGCPVVSRVTFSEIFSPTACFFCTILNDVIRHMCIDFHAPRGFRSSLNHFLKENSDFFI